MLDTDLEAILNERHPPAKACRTGWALDGLPEQTRELMVQVLDSGAPAARVADAFQAREWPVNAESVRRHRLGRCLCPDRRG